MLLIRGVAFGTILLFSVVGLSCSRSKDLPQESNRYIDSRSCATCHAGIYETYRHTGMARAFYAPSADSIPNARPYFHRASGTWYQVLAKNNAFYQRTWQAGYSGNPDTNSDVKIDYVMGSGNHVRTFLHRTSRNTLIELPLAWYAEKGGYWALNPGFDVSHPPVNREIGYDCMFCHNAYPAIPVGHEEAGAEPVYSGALPEGIDCQRCHGPGENHVRAAQVSQPKREDIRKAIFNPKSNMEVCMQCHLETTSFALPNAIRRFDRGPYSYRPGEPLAAFMLFFDHAPGSGHDDKFEIVSSAYRLRKSQCFLKSDGRLTCTTCHNPHDIPHGTDALDRYNRTCRQCHSVVQAKAHPANPNCVSCHMPKRRTEDVVHAVMTDHLIQRRAPANALAELAERHGDEYRGEVTSYGASDELYTAVAQVLQKSNLNAGIPRLEEAIAKHQPAPAEAYLELGDAYRNVDQESKARTVYQQALTRKPNSALILRRLGQPQQAVQAEPSNAEAWYDLGLMHSEQGRKSEAVTALRKATEFDPEFAEAWNSLGAALAEIGQPDQAESAFRKALVIDPNLTGAHGNLANLLSAKGHLPEAIWNYERATGTAIEQFNWGVTLARLNRLAEAQTHVENALRSDPNLAEAHDVLGGLLENKGRIDAALAEYRQAVRLRPSFGKAHLDIGAILAGRRDFTGAAEEFKKAASDPEVRDQAIQALQSLPH